VQFGGGKEVAHPVLEEALKKYEVFKPENSISPGWGRMIVKNILDQISKDKK
jgi:hypothetical protein